MKPSTLPEVSRCVDTDADVTWSSEGWLHPDGTRCRHDLERRDPPKPSPEARRIGTLAMVEVGCLLYSEERVDQKDRPLGGVVVQIDEGAGVDPETGEIRGRTFLVLNPYTRKVEVTRLKEREVGELSVALPKEHDLRRQHRKLAYDVSMAVGPVLPTEVDRLRWAYQLAVVASGGRAL